MLAHLRSRLPAYMTPAYLERLPFIPTLVSNKADRAQLPKPKSAPIRVSATHAEPRTALERLLCEALKSALALDAVSIDGDFFKEYGAHSLLMARFCARIRQIRRVFFRLVQILHQFFRVQPFVRRELLQSCDL